MPTGYTGIYSDWNVDVDGDGSLDDPWDFGKFHQYPIIKGVLGQRRAFIHADHWNSAIVGEYVTVGLIGKNLRDKRKDSSNGDGAGNWKWERSSNGVSGWVDVSSRSLASEYKSYLFIPESRDTNHFLRAHVTIEHPDGKEEEVYTTAIVIRADSTRYRTYTDDSLSGGFLHTGDKGTLRVSVYPRHRTYWRWRRCDDAGMSANCQYVFPLSASGEYKPVQADVGKYLQAYVYYTDRNGAWTRVTTKVVGPVYDYDKDDDGLIEISNLAQLNAIRWDLNGDGQADRSGDASDYGDAFPTFPKPDGINDMGCPSPSGCTGYELITDLDFDENGDGIIDSLDATYWYDGAGWQPINHNGGAITFEGNGYTISNLYLNCDNKSRVGLFSEIDSPQLLKNLNLTNVEVTGGHYTGALVGYVNGGTIFNVHSTGEVTGRNGTGGLAGRITDNGSIEGSWSSVTVSGEDRIGGLVGHLEESSLTESYATGVVRGNSKVGGLVGESSGDIKVAYAAGGVTGTDRIGGLVGDLQGGSVEAVYSIGRVLMRRSSSGAGIGGLIGFHGSGIVGGSSKGVYWDRETSGQSGAGAGVDTSIVQSKTTRELQMPLGYTGIYAGWNLDLDRDDIGDEPWDFGGSRQYPVIAGVPGQRRAFISADHWNSAVVGELVTVGLDQSIRSLRIEGWKWAISPNGIDNWVDVSSRSLASENKSYLFIPEAGDADKYLRAHVTIKHSDGKEEEVYTTTLMVKRNSTASDTSGVFLSGDTSPQVGQAIQVEVSSGDWDDSNPSSHGDDVNIPVHRSYWRWERCDDLGMSTNCEYVFPAGASDEYMPVSADSGKHLRAYVYYTDKDNGNAWSRAATSVISIP